TVLTYLLNSIKKNRIMAKLNPIGLDAKKADDLADKLNELLANYSIFYQNVRGFHWHIKGDKFFELHDKFEELYTNLLVKIDEVAERILTLGHVPNHKYSEYGKDSEIKESEKISNGDKAEENILDTLKVIITTIRE